MCEKIKGAIVGAVIGITALLVYYFTAGKRTFSDPELFGNDKSNDSDQIERARRTNNRARETNNDIRSAAEEQRQLIDRAKEILSENDSED